ncbi:MAG: TrmH family RNA methyltransferase [Patescibacteria group bacterium]|jgi:TrmH family RNA methyltransferase
MSLEITSFSNPKIKLIKKLLKNSSLRQKEGLVIIDGKREINEALQFGWIIEELFFSPDIINKQDSSDFLNYFLKNSKNSYQLNKNIFNSISYKKSPDGFLAVLRSRFLKWDDLKIKKNPFVLILETVEKPGNLGAIIRTAQASEVDLLILVDQKTDLYSPNVIRASTGFVFSLPIIISSYQEALDWCQDREIKIFSTALRADKSCFEVDFSSPTAVVFGSEATGLSPVWLESKDQISIPMKAGIDSLNVSVSVGIISYEAWRQRNFLK